MRSGKGRAALAVAAGILLSRISGLLRERVLAHYLGNSEAAGAFKAALRIPNLLQNLFGDGVLSASFVPLYSRLRAEGREAEADQLARAVFTALLLLVSLVVALGMTAAPVLVDIIAPGFEGAVRELAIELVVIVFPGVGLLVLSAWCLGVLNSHRRFLLSYTAPVLWNIAQIVALVVVASRSLLGESSGTRLSHAVAWGTVAGSLLQLLVLLVPALRLLRRLRPSFQLSAPVRRAFSTFVPVLTTRGVVQLSAYVDQILASLIGASTVAAMAYAQQLYMLPISLFGMAVSAAALPELSSIHGTPEQVSALLRERVASDRLRIAFFVVPSAIAFLGVGDALIALLFQTGRFTNEDTRFVWAILCGFSVGLLATTQARLLSSALYALAEPRAPFRAAVWRVCLGAVLGYLVAGPLQRRLGWPPSLAAAGLAGAGGIAAWVELWLLSRALEARIGPLLEDRGCEARIALGAMLAGASAFGMHRVPSWPWPWLDGMVTAATFAAAYFLLTLALGVPHSRAIWRRSRRGAQPNA
jgi:putative peptidoglycan lipid II flippase